MIRFDLLNQLANFLDDLPHDRFHMPAWVSNDATARSCGTAGCAAGWAATIFQRHGFVLRVNEMLSEVPGYGSQPCPYYKGEFEFEAFAKFFHIPREFAYWITSSIDPVEDRLGELGGDSYCEQYGLANGKDVTPRHAADRIRQVILELNGEVQEDVPWPATVKLKRLLK